MVFAEFVLIAFVAAIASRRLAVGIATLGVLLFVYRLKRISTAMAFLLVAFWTAAGFQLGAAFGSPLGRLAAAALCAVVAIHVHRDALRMLLARRPNSEPLDGPVVVEPAEVTPKRGAPQQPGRVIDVEYRVIS